MSDFERYCIGCHGSVPEEGTDDYRRLLDAFNAWSAYRELMK